MRKRFTADLLASGTGDSCAGLCDFTSLLKPFKNQLCRPVAACCAYITLAPRSSSDFTISLFSYLSCGSPAAIKATGS